MKFILAINALCLVTFACNVVHTTSFAPASNSFNNRTAFVARGAKYGPDDTETAPPVDAVNQIAEPTPEERASFEKLFADVMACTDRDHLPSLVTKNIDLLMNVRGNGVMLFNDELAKAQETGDEEIIERANAAVEYIVFFVETFVSQLANTDTGNKALLGKIFKTVKNAEGDSSSLERQEQLDAMIKEEKANFTPGFLRHLEAVCAKIAGSKTMTPESAKMLEIMRVIQARIVEELGAHLGEGAQVLGQLLGYETSDERLAVLDAGLTVRGLEFALELKAMTEEALDGFEKMAGGVDPGLLAIVAEVDARIGEFISENEE